MGNSADLSFLKPIISIPSHYSLDSIVNMPYSSYDFSTNGSNIQDKIPTLNHSEQKNYEENSTMYSSDKENTAKKTIVDDINALFHFVKQNWHILRLIVQLTLIIVFLTANLKLYIKCKQNRIPYKTKKEAYLNIYLLENITSPFLFCTSIYLDASMTKDEKITEQMITHEYVHYKHFDGIWTTIRLLCLALFWYHPFLWIANEYIKRDCELACDEDTLSILGDSARQEYGRTLLLVAQSRSEKREIAITATTSMSGKMHQLKERIEKITRKTPRHFLISSFVLLLILSATGCAFMGNLNIPVETSIFAGSITQISTNENNPRNMMDSSQTHVIAEETANISSIENENLSDDTSYNIYNSVKYYNGYYYYSDLFGLKRLDRDLIASEIIASGNAKLGNVNDSCLYYLRYPSDNSDDAGVFRIHLDTCEEENLIDWFDVLWLYSNLYANGSILYLEKADGCSAYRINNEGTQRLSQTDNLLYQALKDLSIPIDGISFPTGFTNTYFLYGKLTFFTSDGNLCVYDKATNTLSFTIEDAEHDILLSDKGIVYHDSEYNIYTWDWNDTTPICIYSINQNRNQPVNYGTIEDGVIYGFIEENNSCIPVSIDWAGKIKTGRIINDVNRASDLGYSVNHGVQSYWQNGKLIFK